MLLVAVPWYQKVPPFLIIIFGLPAPFVLRSVTAGVPDPGPMGARQSSGVKHVVMFGVKELQDAVDTDVSLARKDDTTAEQMDAVKRCLVDMPGKIKQIKSCEYGADLNLPSGQSHPSGKNRAITFSATFASEAGYEEYATHPAHVACINEFIKPIQSHVGSSWLLICAVAPCRLRYSLSAATTMNCRDARAAIRNVLKPEAFRRFAHGSPGDGDWSQHRLTCGQHAGRTYSEVAADQTAYCNWVLDVVRNDVQSPLRDFADFLQHFHGSVRPRGAAPLQTTCQGVQMIPKVGFGKHRGQAYVSVMQDYPDYCKWVVANTTSSSCVAMQQFSRFLISERASNGQRHQRTRSPHKEHQLHLELDRDAYMNQLRTTVSASRGGKEVVTSFLRSVCDTPCFAQLRPYHLTQTVFAAAKVLVSCTERDIFNSLSRVVLKKKELNPCSHCDSCKIVC
ncbi:unnamed protein product [Prorocentrum cordatum]|uniref:Stress-response A/B barrel domain-containing protein n=2 Tax=Prorocentrum cordatum TaxID=2364126 RepID=A0ABN9TUD2_9DINO|nr:unnamed protein product [Polarella glacialis]